MLNLMTNPRPITLDEMVSELLDCDIYLFGEEGHWYPNILDKEKKAIQKVAEKSSKNLIIALEYDITTPRNIELYGEYIKNALNFFQSLGQVEEITPKDCGFRGLEMGKKIIDLVKKYPDSIIIPIVGANHITPSGSEIPAYLIKEISDHSLEKRLARVFFKTATCFEISKKAILKSFDLKGTIYFF